MELIRIQNNTTSKEEAPFKIFLTSERPDSIVENISEDINSHIDRDLDTVHILGRGPLLQVIDSRVSRKHAIACYHKKEKTWSVIALRDCYYYLPSENTNMIDADLENIQWTTLKKHDILNVKNGFLISLLPNCEHAYKLIINKVKTDDNIQCNDQKDVNSTGVGSLSNNEQITTSTNDKENNTDSLSKTRKLPNWMSKSASSEKEIPTSSFKSTSNDRLEVLKEKESVVNQSSISSTSITKCGTEKKSKTYSAAKSTFLKTWGWAIGDLEDFESKPNGIINSTSDIKPSSSSNESKGLQSKAEDNKVCEVPWYERSFAVANNTEAAETEIIKPNDSNQPDTDSSQLVQTTSTSSQPNADTRISCPFGINCYRKNPQHKIDEAHPGDADYIDPSSMGAEDAPQDGEPDNRPECEYGLQCYRKNPQHRKDYKHSSNSRASKRKAAKDLKKFAKKTAGNHLSGDDDEYESDFINDESDMDEDISSDEEDVDEWKPEDEDD